MSTLKSFIKNTLVYGIAAVLPKAINVFLVALHTKILPSTADFNTNTEYYVWAAYFNVLLTFGMETTFFKFFNAEKDKAQVLNTTFSIIALVAILLLTPLFFLADTIAPILEFSETSHFKILIITALLDTLVVIPFAYLRVKNKALNYAIFKTLNITVYAILNILFLWYLPTHGYLNNFNLFNNSSQVGYIFLANLIASGFIFILLLPLFSTFRIQLNFTLLKKMLHYSWPILIAGIAYITNENLDKLILPRYLNESIAGAYAGTYKLGVFMSLFITAFKLGAEPFFFNIAKQKNAKTTYALILEWFTILGSLIVLFIVSYIDFFASLLLKQPEYFETLAIVPVILLANLLLGIYNNLSVWYKNTGQTKYAMYFSILGGVLTITGLVTLVPIFGYMGAAWVTFGVYAVMMITSYLYGQKHYKTPYQVFKIIGLFLFTTALSFVSFYFFRGDFMVNTLFIIITLVFLYFSQQKFIKQRLVNR
ncbi:O-antigen/teichoic acid export membrane protein [Wenyingzhuangia heitensis]|uniref:O-antigen/teichoic acid export membrane protein n=1 Tax=Wenyingzhuangia heitensis TaxID=1487859 RepID=A0ABX0U5D8_9FLAO|nr:polysaccharide biosynthesis C-terminal domain-containing protein [Wenyingzhuangia heitensis]NIJ44069.1 O-antigen/teichoic acid export membrane protein [Wenyingzhuangia heitensis]